MSAPDSLSTALALAAAQMNSLTAGDIDGYLGALAAYEAACTSLPGELSPADSERLNELIALDARLAAELCRSRDELAQQMACLQQSRLAAGAYLAAPTSRREPIFEG
jgi:hypothetical protein